MEVDVGADEGELDAKDSAHDRSAREVSVGRSAESEPVCMSMSKVKLRFRWKNIHTMPTS